LRNLQQQVGERVKVHYECLLKFANCLQVKATNVFITTTFKRGLQPYLRLAIVGMTRDTLIEHKKIVMICEENGHVIANYNILITRPRVQTGCTTYSCLYYC
jgi:hypothetical protein